MFEFIGHSFADQTMISIVAIGILIGIGHSFEIEHILAVTTLVSEKKYAAPWKIGSSWGIGHSITTMIIGTVLLFLDVKLPGSLYEVGEIAVGITLIYIGLKYVVFKEVRNTHKHKHGSEFGHLNPMQKLSDWNVTSVLVGMVHGVAGSGFLILLLITSSETIDGVLFLSSFCISIIVTMGIVTQLWKKLQGIHEKSIGNIAGIASIIAGLWLIVEYI